MQFTFQRRTDLALQALALLNGDETTTSGPSIAAQIDTTTAYLPQVMAPLVKAGWVGSDRGPGGGYHLRVALEDLSLLDVIEAFEGPVASGTCVLRGGPCPGDLSCQLHTAWSQIRDTVIRELGTRSVLTDQTLSQGERP